MVLPLPTKESRSDPGAGDSSWMKLSLKRLSGYPEIIGCQEAGSDDLLAKMAYLLLAAAGNFNLHFVRAGARVRLADLIDVDFPLAGAEAVLSDAVVRRRVDYHTVTQDVYVAAIRWGPAKGPRGGCHEPGGQTRKP